MEKRINIFSDSWYWSWNHTLKSQPGEIDINLPSMKWFLEDKGYKVTAYAQPAHSFQQIVNKYFRDESFIPNGDYSFIYFSGIVRRRTNDWINYVGDYDKFNEWYDAEVNLYMDIVERWAIKHNHPVIIAGGHSRLDAKYVEGRKNIYLLCEDIIQELVAMYHPSYVDDDFYKSSFRRFKLTRDIVDKEVDKWHPKLVDEIYTSLRDFESNPYAKLFMWPDSGHLNIQSHYYLVDWLVDFIEKKLVN